MKIFAFPFAGGNARSYRSVSDHLSRANSLQTVELPGRGSRFLEPRCHSLTEMVERCLCQVQPVPNQDYALYGHSMGALLAFEVCRRMWAAGTPPVHLFVSGRQAPAVKSREQRWGLPETEFREVLRALGCAPEVLDSNELMEVFSPILRSDFRAVEEYVHQDRPVMQVPITVLLGEEDDVTVEDAARWGVETSAAIETVWFPGGHFFLLDHPRETALVIEQRLALSQVAEQPVAQSKTAEQELV